ncbi:MAG: putative Fe-S cluster assembly protein SufT [Verrucomicrobia bacterium]|nr:putative Fe-S cluster assembly protein SufT [Verrucomicrobiota bacterium]
MSEDTTRQRHAPGPHDRNLTRDVQATVIPAGEPAVLPAGARVTITHRLGGNFTVVCDSGMFRIKGADADSLGEQPPAEGADAEGKTDAYGSTGTAEHPGHKGRPSEEAVWNQLKKVFDPEIPVNIVDLGLVYSMMLEPIDGSEDRYRVIVAMTLTAPGCGMGPVIAEDARNRVLNVPGVNEARVGIVWDPPWTQSMISEDGKMQLGLI